MSKNTLYDKVWDSHTVARLDSGQDQIFIGLHLIHEVTTPQAFGMLKEIGAGVAFPGRTIGTVDHIIPTLSQIRPYEDELAEKMMAALEQNVNEFGVSLSAPEFRQAGHRPRHRAGAGAQPARHDHRLRRQPHEHARRDGFPGIRHRHDRSGPRPGDADPGAEPPEGEADRGHGRSRPRRYAQGRDFARHSRSGHQGRPGLRLRIRGRRFSTTCRWKDA